MYEFESLLEEILRNKPDMTRSDIIESIEAKKRVVGAGYLTDQGALFLIAGELGVQLKHLTSDLTLKDLYLGANDITIVARVLATYPISEYKKKDGSVGRYRRVNLFDRESVVRLTIWDDNHEAIGLEGIVADTLVRVSNAYVRPGLDNKPSLNLGKRGRIDAVNDQMLASKIASLSRLAKSIGQAADDQNVLAIEGIASSNSRSSNFVRGDGTPGSLTQFDIAGTEGTKSRVVVWNPRNIPEVKAGQAVFITNVRVKKGNNGEREFHGDSGSLVQVNGSSQSKTEPVLTKINQVVKTVGPINLEVMALSEGVANEVSLKDGTTTRKAELVIGDDTGEITIVGWREAAEKLSGIDVGQKVRIFGVERRISRLGVETLQLESASKIEVLPS